MFRNLLKWRLKLRDFLKSQEPKEPKIEQDELVAPKKADTEKAEEETLEDEIEDALVAEQKIEKKFVRVIFD